MTNLFGVTPAVLMGQVQGLTIRSNTQPSTTDVEEMILDAAGEAESEAIAVGIDLQGFTDPQYRLYRTARAMIIARVLSTLLVGKDRGQDMGKFWHDRFLDARETLRKRPQAVDNKDSGPDLAWFVEEGIGPSPWDYTIAGKLSRPCR
jgi:hypothetical protein